MKHRCVCGCGRRKGLHKHHCVTQQRLREVARERAGRDRADRLLQEAALVSDRRNIVMVAWRCHQAHHNANQRLRLDVLPDSVFEFAAEVLGAGAAHDWLRRYYNGNDPRLDALLETADV